MVAEDAHQGALAPVLLLMWWNADAARHPAALSSLMPDRRIQVTDRIAAIRSGYEWGDTYLYFNGDLFLSSRKEMLCTVSGMAWHYPYHQFAVAESGIETEGEPVMPSMVIKESHAGGPFDYVQSVSGTSNVAYYALKAQEESYKHYIQRDRDILYSRPSGPAHDYFVFVDRIRQAEPRWHAFNWHLWDSQMDGRANWGRFAVEQARAVRGQRPNADIWLQFLGGPAPGTGGFGGFQGFGGGAGTGGFGRQEGGSADGSMGFEQAGVPSQGHVSYQMDHNCRLLRAMIGGYAPVTAAPTVLPAEKFQAQGQAPAGMKVAVRQSPAPQTGGVPAGATPGPEPPAAAAPTPTTPAAPGAPPLPAAPESTAASGLPASGGAPAPVAPSDDASPVNTPSRRPSSAHPDAEIGASNSGAIPAAGSPSAAAPARASTAPPGPFLALEAPGPASLVAEAPAALVAGCRYRLSAWFQARNYGGYAAEVGATFTLETELLDASGKPCASSSQEPDPQKPHPLRLSDPSPTTGTHPWLESASFFDAPPGVASVRVTLRIYIAGQDRYVTSHADPKRRLGMSRVLLEPLGTPLRERETLLLALVMPLGRDEPGPQLSAQPTPKGAAAGVLDHGDGYVDHLFASLAPGVLIPLRNPGMMSVGFSGTPAEQAAEAARLQGGEVDALEGILRTRGFVPVAAFARNARRIRWGQDVLFETRALPAATNAPAAAAVTDEPTAAPAVPDGGVLNPGATVSLDFRDPRHSRVRVHAACEVRAGKTQGTLAPGLYSIDGDRFVPVSDPNSLATNSEETAAALRQGLKRVLDQEVAERDEYVRRGWKNLALSARARASAVRDDRFPASAVNDNRTSEYPADGHLRYAQGDLLSTGFVGYGAGDRNLMDQPIAWPLYIPPTWWLLPVGETGWVELELEREATVRLVRLLNTSNGGLNDQATMAYGVELLDAKRRRLRQVAGEFGRVADEAFQAAFARPELFHAYAPCFQGMLEPGVKVPFATGWSEHAFAPAVPGVRHVRITIKSYWAIGGGLNEVQVY